MYSSLFSVLTSNMLWDWRKGKEWTHVIYHFQNISCSQQRWSFCLCFFLLACYHIALMLYWKLCSALQIAFVPRSSDTLWDFQEFSQPSPDAKIKHSGQSHGAGAQPSTILCCFSVKFWRERESKDIFMISWYQASGKGCAAYPIHIYIYSISMLADIQCMIMFISHTFFSAFYRTWLVVLIVARRCR